MRNYFQRSVLEDNGAVDIFAIKTNIDAGIFTAAISLHDNAIAVLGMANTNACLVWILICNLAIFIINDFRATRSSRLR